MANYAWGSCLWLLTKLSTASIYWTLSHFCCLPFQEHTRNMIWNSEAKHFSCFQPKEKSVWETVSCPSEREKVLPFETKSARTKWLGSGGFCGKPRCLWSCLKMLLQNWWRSKNVSSNGVTVCLRLRLCAASIPQTEVFWRENPFVNEEESANREYVFLFFVANWEALLFCPCCLRPAVRKIRVRNRDCKVIKTRVAVSKKTQQLQNDCLVRECPTDMMGSFLQTNPKEKFYHTREVSKKSPIIYELLCGTGG